MLNRSLPPAVKEISSVQLPVVEVSSFTNGSRLHAIFNSTQPIIKFEIVLKAGKWYEPYGGIAYLAAKMLLEGTESYSAKQIAEKIAFYGASLECNAGFDRATITLYCLAKHFEPLIHLLSAIVFLPVFPEKEFNSLKLRTIQNISIEKRKNSYLANQLFTRNIYGSDHPYVSGMDEVTLSQSLIIDVKEFYHRYYNLTAAEIFICGDFNADNLQTITTLFGQCATQPVFNSSLKSVTHLQVLKKTYFEKEDSLQSSIRVGGPFPSINHADYHHVSILNKILGGYFGSRLMRNIREDKGFTYGIFSSVSVREHDTIHSISTEVNYQNTEQTLTEIYKEIKLLQVEPVSQEELITVKNYTIGKLINDLNTIFDQLDKYKSIVLHNLPSSFYSDYIESVKYVTSYNLLDLANQYYQLDSLFEVVVGKNKK